MKEAHVEKKDVNPCTVESWFFEPPRETKIGSKNWIFREIGGKITVFNWGDGNDFWFELLGVWKNEGSKNWDSTVLYQAIYKASNQLFYKPRLVTGSNCTCVWVSSLEDPLTSLNSDRTSCSSQSSHFLHRCQYQGGFFCPQVATCVHRTLKMFYLNLAF